MSKDGHELSIDVRRAGATVEVRVGGEVDLKNSPRLRTALADLISSKPTRIILDLATVSYIDSSGMGTIVEFRRKVDAIGGILVLACLQPRVRSVLEITRLDNFFRIAETLEEARKA